MGENAGAVIPDSEPDETRALGRLAGALTPPQRERALTDARAMVAGARARIAERSRLDAFLQEFGLSNPEGIALMCLAESLLRVPDDGTADRLIAERLAGGDWGSHAGRSDSLFVNASTWALMLTGRLVDLPEGSRGDPGRWLAALTRRAGEPLVREALRRAMQILGGEFVVGRDIHDALARGRRDPTLALCSFDMLGEGARTDAQARHHLDAYARAIEAVARAAPSPAAARGGGTGVHARSSISIKLSALEPRLALVQRERVHARLVPRAMELARLAARHGLALTVDAEEQDRLEISLEVLEALAADRQTRDWEGLGLAVQAYGLRAPAVIDAVNALAAATRRRMAVRLVKGAYWDSEIKRAQERGLGAYPVYTRKCSTDVAYLDCARRLLDAAARLYAQFATHNAHTIAAVLAMRPAGTGIEFQRLHGMGTLLYDEARRRHPDLPPVRVYAPVGPHEDLLAYLVRRLLENGANTSFVNRFLDEHVPLDEIVADPVTALEALDTVPNPAIPLPDALLLPQRRNSRGVDFGRRAALEALRAALATPLPALPDFGLAGEQMAITSPADRSRSLATLRFASAADVDAAFGRAAAAQPGWDATPADARAACLERAADRIEDGRDRLVALLVREAGKTLPDAVAEVREAADFCRYYAAEARRLFGAAQPLPGPTGETNELHLRGRGVVACISPWNFPLAIFTGQVAAALAAGNAVVAKPAESTPLVALAATDLLREAGLPAGLLQTLPMAGRAFGEAALGDPRLAGVVFTGSTATAQWLNRRLAARDGAILPLVAETGGINAMIVDSTALPEQVVDDAIASAFGSAGQRCSALRLLCLQDDVADRILDMLAGAMDELVIGDPADPATDVGPVISAAAAALLDTHVAEMANAGRVLHRRVLDPALRLGTFFPPTLVEIREASALRREAFGPVLHVLRYAAPELPRLLESIRASGYGLTLGIQTRLDATRELAWRQSLAGNVYVNRGMTGAVVGVQPFGGTGLSGTGPKAGGPHYLARLATERVLTVNTTATGGNTALLGLG
jgi:RHH-type proline utilization regulon transcriptional repressor/proline dehydrogenase/delta 1-pyrroline-5-carboxylate dehydrogenase